MVRRRSRRAEERRQRLFIVLFKLALVIGAFGLTAYYAYETGARVAHGEVATLRQDLGRALDDAKAEADRAAADRASLAEAQKQADDFKALYDQVKPSDDIKDLTTLLRAKLASGMTVRRLGYVISAAQNPHGCKMLASKRFLVRTPRYRGPPSITSVHIDDEISISADGAGANDGQEQWFDPERPIKIHLATGGPKETELSGKLPVEHAMAAGALEYHFTLSAAGARGWVDVATERCEVR
jgi:hypothetical protein